MPTVLLGFLTLVCLFASAASAEKPSKEPTTEKKYPITTRTVPRAGEFNQDLRNVPYTPPDLKSNLLRPELEPPPLQKKRPMPGVVDQPQSEVDQSSPVPFPMVPIPSPTVTINGLDLSTWGAGWPPDTVGDVGPNHYIEAVNTSIGIYSKAGATLAQFTFNTLWSGAGSGTACDTSNTGDPTVLYDSLADRWIVSDIAFTAATLQNGPYIQCFAVSKTSDPVAGGWYLYAIRPDDATHPWLNDYPKMAIWPDALYWTANMFDCLTANCSSATFQEVRAFALDKGDMYNGKPVDIVIADLGTTSYFALVPSHYRAHTPPPAGRDNLLVSESGTLFAWEVWKFHVVFGVAGSTFTGPTNVSQTAYTVAPATVVSPGNALDTLRERAMMQNHYRRLGAAESLWVSHTVQTAVAGVAGIQWAQINVSGGAVVSPPVQQQIYGNIAGDGVSRWMPSMAADRAGNVMLGYSATRNTVAPDIRVAGRLVGDAANTMAQTETTMLPAVVRANQTGICPNPGGGTCTRWGDYTAMNLDPNGCTFWYVGEYYLANGINWQTRIAATRFPVANCAGNPGEPSNLMVTKSGANIVLSWTAPAAACTNRTGYGLYKGNLSSFPSYTHASYPTTSCLGNVTTTTQAMPADATAYFLVTSSNATEEGSYGRSTVPTERPQAASPCLVGGVTPVLLTLGTCS